MGVSLYMQIKRILFFWSLFLLSSTVVVKSLIAQPTNTKSKVEVRFKVYGNCGACEERINEALDQKGIVAGGWDRVKQEVWVVYRPSKVTLEQIHRYIAAVGHDTDLMKADTAVYHSLPNCCLYREKHSPH